MDTISQAGTGDGPPRGTDPLDRHVPCIRCEYNLRGLPADGNCPECNEPVEHSLRPDQLSLADPDWLRRIRTGAAWLVWAGAVDVFSLVEFYLASWMIDNWDEFHLYMQDMVTGALTVVAILVTLASGVIITAPERVQASQNDSSMRRIARIALVVYCILILATWSLALADSWVWITVGVLSDVAGLIGGVALLCYGRRLAMRIPDRWLARLAWLGACGYVLDFPLNIARTVLVYFYRQAQTRILLDDWGYSPPAGLLEATWMVDYINTGWSILIGTCLLAFLLRFRRQVRRILDA